MNLTMTKRHLSRLITSISSVESTTENDNYKQHILLLIKDILKALSELSEFNFDENSRTNKELSENFSILRHLGSENNFDEIILNIDEEKYEFYCTKATSILITSRKIIDNYKKEKLEKDYEKSFNKILKDSKNELIKNNKDILESVSNTNGEIKVLKEDLDRLNSLKDSISRKYDDLNNNFSMLHKIWLENNNLMSAQKAKYDKSIKEYEETLYNAINSSSKKLDVYREKQEEKYIIEINKQKELVRNKFDEIKNEFSEFSNFIEKFTEAKMSDEYAKKANIEMWVYISATIASLLIIFTAIGISYCALDAFAQKHVLNNQPLKELDLIYLGIKLIFSVLIASAVALTSKVASRSYMYWKKNENISLKLTALKPFMANMPKEKQQEISEKLVDVYFGKDENEQNINQKLKDLPDNITQLLGKVIDQTSAVLDSSQQNNSPEKNEKQKDDDGKK